MLSTAFPFHKATDLVVKQWSFWVYMLVDNNQTKICQWTHLRRFAIDSTLKFTWKVCREFIGFEKRIHVEIMTSIRWRYFEVVSTFEIDEISMSSPHRLFYVVSMSNQHNCSTHCFLSIIFEHFLLWEPILIANLV